MQIIVVTGLSGSGKSIAIRQLEDSGYYCIDNLPVGYITPVIDSLHADGFSQVAVAIDSRTHADPGAPREKIHELKQKGYEVKVLSLTASTPCLVKRFSETRRRHPLTPVDRQPGDQSGLQEAIDRERAISDLQIGFLLDTSDYSFPYIAGWSSSVDMKELKNSMDTIRKTAGEIIDGVESELEKQQEKAEKEISGENRPSVLNVLAKEKESLTARSENRTEKAERIADRQVRVLSGREAR